MILIKDIYPSLRKCEFSNNRFLNRVISSTRQFTRLATRVGIITVDRTIEKFARAINRFAGRQCGCIVQTFKADLCIGLFPYSQQTKYLYSKCGCDQTAIHMTDEVQK